MTRLSQRKSSSWSMGLYSFSATVTKFSAHGTGKSGLESDLLGTAMQCPEDWESQHCCPCHWHMSAVSMVYIMTFYNKMQTLAQSKHVIWASGFLDTCGLIFSSSLLTSMNSSCKWFPHDFIICPQAFLRN